MRTTVATLALTCLIALSAPAADEKPAPLSPPILAELELPAFPGAEGFGAASVGGRGGKVVKVTTLEPTGPGSLQEALSAKGPRIVVFDVSGVIKAPRKGKYYALDITEPNVTIAGQTAPGAGITLEGMLKNPYKMKPHLNDVTVRFLRMRPPRPAGVGQGGDCVQLTEVHRLILDHCTVSWGNDECIDVCNSRSLTIQWSTIEESEREGHEKGHHNFGMIMGYDGRDATVHHNLFAHHKRRAPLCGLETLDHRNNVIYNMWSPLLWHPLRMNYNRPDQPFRANVIGNYFKAGPNCEDKHKVDTLDGVMNSPQNVHMHETGNYFDWKQATVGRTNGPKAEQPWPAPKVTTTSAEQAYKDVLASAGCLPRDVVSRRTIEEVRTGKGEWGRHDPEGGLMAGMNPGKPAPDADNDGMPDAWEKAHGLNPADASDATKIVPKGASENDRHAGYTYIEFYVNELADKLVADAISADKKE